MTATMMTPFAAPAERAEPEGLRELMQELQDAVAAQHRMLDALDARREQLDELVADAMPVANAAMLLASRAATSLDERLRSLAGIRGEIAAVANAPAPGLLTLLWRLRTTEARRALAIGIEGLRVLGRLADDSAPHHATRSEANDNLHRRAR